MIDFSALNRRPIVVAIAGPNGAGKTTFFHSHLGLSGLRFVNADVLAAELELGAYEAARLANALRIALVERRESFVFETVFSDPIGDKVNFLAETVQLGYEVLLCYIGLASPDQSIDRVAMRVSQGGHDVPDEKLAARFPRSLTNLRLAMKQLPHVLVYDNSDLRTPYQLIAACESGRIIQFEKPTPTWFAPFLN